MIYEWMVIQCTKASHSRAVGMVEVSGNRGSDLGRDGTVQVLVLSYRAGPHQQGPMDLSTSQILLRHLHPPLYNVSSS